MEKPKFEFYERPNGHNEFLEFLENLPQKDQAKLMAVIYKVQIHGLLTAIITHGFSKKTQKTPRKEILHALAIYKEFEEENDANS